jgi:hypothetical protein
MARKPELHPAWLVGLLHQWASRRRAEESRTVGWYSINPMLKEGIPVRAESYEPTGYSGHDFKNLEAAMQAIDSRYAIAVIRYVRPEKARGFDVEYGYSADTWLRYLRAGLADLDTRMESLDKRRFAVIL